ncbi:MAG: nitric oxide synthase oxygenase [Hydrococcus sp. SU_1_0]|nr:nitric oxide synthase oxygenase [Hydrococcus sp. SU_1_0]
MSNYFRPEQELYEASLRGEDLSICAEVIDICCPGYLDRKRWCEKNGWSGLFLELQSNKWYAFPPECVMPVEIPSFTIKLKNLAIFFVPNIALFATFFGTLFLSTLEDV